MLDRSYVKKTKAASDYKLGGSHCGACKFFIDDGDTAGDDESGHCQLVEGKIGEDMGCKYFQRGQATKRGSVPEAVVKTGKDLESEKAAAAVARENPYAPFGVGGVG
jgi:hypothetical protein